MKIILLVGLGGFIGSILRLLISEFVQTKSLGSFPYGTLVVNIIGCFLIGLVFSIVEKGALSAELRFFIATGIIGGFTTYSAFSYETFSLLRDGQIWAGISYILLSIVLGLLSTMAGFFILRWG